MANKLLGIDIFAAATTTAAHEKGVTADVPIGGNAPTVSTGATVSLDGGGEVRYVLASGTITAGDAVKIDLTAAVADRSYSVNRTAAVTDKVEGIALVSAIAGQFLFVATKGVVTGANVATAVAAGEAIGASASAGRLDAVAEGTAANLEAYVGGRRGVNLIVAASNLSTVYLLG